MILFWVIVVLVLGTAGVAGLSAAPWLPTRKGEIALLKTALEDADGLTIYDLGSGDGRILFALSKQLPEAKLIGIELSLAPFLWSIARKYIGQYKNVSLRYGNLFKKDISNADIVITFLLDKAYARLQKKFQKELKPDARILVEAWPLPHQTPEYIFEKQGILKIFEYRIKQSAMSPFSDMREK